VRFLSLRARVALFGTLIVFGAVVAFAELLLGLVQLGEVDTTNKGLRTRADAISAWVATASPDQLRAQQYLAPADLSRSTDIFAEVIGSDGQVIFSTGVLNGVPPAPPPSLLQAAAKGEAYSFRDPFYFYARIWSRRELGLAGYVLTGQSRRAPIESLAGLRGFLVVSGTIAILLALLASWLVAGRALRPLKTVAATADQIRATRDFSRRLPGPASARDEVGVLTASFNGMLGALQAAFDFQRRFIADASHELRTPLTSIRTNAALLQRHDLAPGDQADAASDIAAEAERMSRLVEDLLTLARADAGVRLERKPVALDELAREAARQFRRANPERRFEEQVAPAAVEGDRDALLQLLLILLDNAAKHTREQGRVELELGASDGTARLVVADDGTGIPASDLERIFERFYQADPSRYRGGAGLGLSIARWITDEHGGTISAANRPEGGARFEVLLPTAS
jgi:signal transduction histidine kinase